MNNFLFPHRFVFKHQGKFERNGDGMSQNPVDRLLQNLESRGKKKGPDGPLLAQLELDDFVGDETSERPEKYEPPKPYDPEKEAERAGEDPDRPKENPLHPLDIPKLEKELMDAYGEKFLAELQKMAGEITKKHGAGFYNDVKIIAEKLPYRMAVIAVAHNVPKSALVETVKRQYGDLLEMCRDVSGTENALQYFASWFQNPVGSFAEPMEALEGKNPNIANPYLTAEDMVVLEGELNNLQLFEMTDSPQVERHECSAMRIFGDTHFDLDSDEYNATRRKFFSQWELPILARALTSEYYATPVALTKKYQDEVDDAVNEYENGTTADWAWDLIPGTTKRQKPNPAQVQEFRRVKHAEALKQQLKDDYRKVVIRMVLLSLLTPAEEAALVHEYQGKSQEDLSKAIKKAAIKKLEDAEDSGITDFGCKAIKWTIDKVLDIAI